jgi:hypothetical protein
VAQLRVDGVTVRDRFWDGSIFRVDVEDCGIRAGSLVELRILPLPTHSRVHLPLDAAARLAAADGALCALDGVVVEDRALWHEEEYR